MTARLWDEGIDTIYSSGYLRAVDTIRDFADKKGLTMQDDPDFREREMGGVWLPMEEWLAANQRQWADFDYSPCGETLRQVESRIRPALDRLLAMPRTGTSEGSGRF